MSKSEKKRGRPPKSDADRRNATPLYIKLTRAEREAIDAAGQPEPTVWARGVLLRAAKRAGCA